eukprot:IDg22765t1
MITRAEDGVQSGGKNKSTLYTAFTHALNVSDISQQPPPVVGAAFRMNDSNRQRLNCSACFPFGISADVRPSARRRNKCCVAVCADTGEIEFKFAVEFERGCTGLHWSAARMHNREVGSAHNYGASAACSAATRPADTCSTGRLCAKLSARQLCWQRWQKRFCACTGYRACETSTAYATGLHQDLLC